MTQTATQAATRAMIATGSRAARRLAAAALAWALAGCVPSGFEPALAPRTPGDDALAHTAGGAAHGAWPSPDWVRQLGDPQLDALVDEALRQNPTLQAAQARIGVAQSQLQQFESLTGLTATAGASLSKAHVPRSGGTINTTFNGLPVSVPLVGESVVSSSSLFVGLNYQLDLWGKNAAATRGLLSMRDAARVEAEQARLALSVAIVTLYGELDRAYALRELLQQKRRASEQVETVLRERAARGIDNGYDADDAALKRGKLLEQLALTDEQIQLQKLQLGVLSGRGPERGLSLARPKLAPLADAPLPARLPAGLLGRRPDIVAARLRVEAAYAAIDGTRASFYPDVNLAALGGLFALTPASLFKHDALGGSIGPALSLPIFDRGRLKAKLGGDVANADVALALYNQTVDAALGEVARQLTSLSTVDALLEAQQQAVRSAQRMVALAEDRHRRGMGMRKDVNVAKLTLLDERAHVIELQARRRTLRVGLIGALGGGFDARPAGGAPLAQGKPFAAASDRPPD
ncbi:RND transporter [Burkholderia thailandensis]|uniref:efflux transporter outer membrane subunit n=4 Tax=Burkholderia thailandensis TaxID=57975 RepID=UPI0003EC76B8|nr:efflux transporter outer membrane subunit [Burkholderia thailandensis]AHI67898.1 efflux transporter, outer membrane factor (OMF) lipo, NodT family protein [Burkholderia thailandensis H0587]AHI67926.1 efflux transporter, outer membrane factor (OMF) lipo, NodT family protein [Burkholderia thailandensis H0587]AIP65676.1 RND transporter [Burkholderia thailandensis]AIP67179.1 RND transporter [Burkholderia thailandensis]AJY31305.1 efflux transporter, outer membrane factor (OMF) lipo, NodT family 